MRRTYSSKIDHTLILWFEARFSSTRSNSGNDPINGETEENAANTAMNRQSQPIATNDCESRVLEIDSESQTKG